jgi:hypothetical protein
MALKDWKKRVDNRGKKVVSNIIIGWGRIYNDESVWVEFSRVRKKYIPLFDNTVGSKELGIYDNQKDAIKKATEFMRTH